MKYLLVALFLIKTASASEDLRCGKLTVKYHSPTEVEVHFEGKDWFGSMRSVGHSKVYDLGHGTQLNVFQEFAPYQTRAGTLNRKVLKAELIQGNDVYESNCYPL